MIISRENIVKVPTLKKIEVEVTEWSANGEYATLFVREMTGRERDQYEASLQSEKRYGKIVDGRKDFRARLAIIVCVDENGKQIFNNSDVEWVSSLSVKPLQRIFNASKSLSELTEEDEEELLKNQTSDSGTTSQ